VEDPYFLYWAIQSDALSLFYIFSGRIFQMENRYNPQSHSAHYFCYLHEYSAPKVQQTPTVSTYIVKSAK